MSDDAVREKLRLYADDVAPTQLPAFGGVTARRRRRRAQQLLSATSAVVVIALVVVLAAVLGGGSSGAPASGLGSELVGGKWALSSITTSGVVWKAPADNGFSLSFTSSGYTGNDSCNGTSGSVSYGHDTVHLGSGAMTELGCLGDDRARMQDAFRLLIDKDLPAVVSGSTLTLTAGQAVLVLTRVQPSSPVDLAKVLPGTTWALASVGTTGPDVSSSAGVPSDVHADISFRSKDFSARDGCNTSDGEVRYEAKSLAFNLVATPAVGCDQGSSTEVTQAYASIFGSASVTATVAGDSLTLANAQRSLTFSRETSDYVAQQLEASLTAYTWDLQSYSNGAKTVRLTAARSVGQQAITLMVTSTDYAASDGCNTHSGPVSFTGGHLVLQQLAVTTVECAADYSVATDLESLYAAMFVGEVGATVHDGGLTLSAGGGTLVYKASAPQKPAAGAGQTPAAVEQRLTGYTWNLAAVNGVAAPRYALTMTATSYRADSKCRTATGAVSYGPPLSLQPGSTEGRCASSASDAVVEKAYGIVFAGAVDVVFDAAGMTLSAHGTTLSYAQGAATGAAVSAPPVATQPASGGIADMTALLIARTWMLTTLKTPTDSWQAIEGSRAALTFTADGYQVSNGCEGEGNSVDYDMAAAQVTFLRTGQGMSMACSQVAPGSPPGSEPPQAYFDALNGPLQVALSGDTMTLTRTGVVLTFVAGDATSAAALADAVVGRPWTLQSLTAPGVTWHPIATSSAGLTFTAATFEATDGCSSNGSDVAYDSTGTFVTFGGGVANATNCALGVLPPAGTNPPAQFYPFFQGKAQVSLRSGTLTLTRGSTVLVFSDTPAAGLQAQLEKVDWQLTAVTQKGVVTAIAASQRARLFLADGNYVMDDGCGLTYGPITYSGTNLSMAAGSTIGTVCTRSAAEQLVQDAFGTVSTSKPVFTVAGDVLTVGGGSTVLSFDRHAVKNQPFASAAVDELFGPTWQLISYADSTGRKVPAPTTDPATLVMTSTEFFAFDGCNQTSGYLTWSGTTVSLRPIGSSDGSCTSNAGGLRSAVASLSGEVSTSVVGNTLTIATAGETLVYHRKPAGPPHQVYLPYLPPD